MTIRPSSASIFPDRRRLLSLIALLLALGEIADAPFISFPAGVIVLAVLFLAGTRWIRRGGIGGPILIALLCLFEVASFPSWARHTTGDWISQIAFVVVSLAGLLLALAVIKRSLNTRKTTTTEPRSRSASTRSVMPR